MSDGFFINKDGVKSTDLKAKRSPKSLPQSSEKQIKNLTVSNETTESPKL